MLRKLAIFSKISLNFYYVEPAMNEVVAEDKKLLGSQKNYDHKKEETRVCYCLAGNLSFRFECLSYFKNASWL